MIRSDDKVKQCPVVKWISGSVLCIIRFNNMLFAAHHGSYDHFQVPCQIIKFPVCVGHHTNWSGLQLKTVPAGGHETFGDFVMVPVVKLCKIRLLMQQ